MAGNPPTEEDDRTQVADDARTGEQPADPHPDESTLGLSSAGSLGPGIRREVDVPELEPGETLADRFTVVRFIARGGMGAVYVASDVLLRTRVALKIIGGRLAADPTTIERFRREVLLARRVTHPNVCRVYELYAATTARGVPIHFLTMELLEGESLAGRLARAGRMTAEEAGPLARQMCDGLAAAHAEGVVHRDFKSSNVLLVPRSRAEGEPVTTSTRAVLTDFGVARAVQLSGEEESPEGALTGRGILGTPDYMAPEQVTGGEVTAAADIYALGVVLYEMVTGKLPFASDTPLASATRRLNEPPPRPRRLVPELDSAWDDAIVRCMARLPERRFRSARDVLPALEPHSGRRRSGIPFAIGAALLLVAAYALVNFRLSPRPGELERTVALGTPRPTVAILGFRNELASPRLNWLPTAITELLSEEVYAAESFLQVLDTDMVEVAQRSLGLSAEDVEDEKAQKRSQALLGAKVLVYGKLSSPEATSGSVWLHIEARDAESRKQLGSVDTDLGPEAVRLVEALPEASGSLRTVLGASMTSEEEGALVASRAHKLGAAKALAIGVMLRRSWELDDARSHLEEAATADPSFLQPQFRLAADSDRNKSLEIWRRIRTQPGALTARRAAVVDARILGLEDARKATEAYRALFESMPDHLQLGLNLQARLPPRAQLALIQRLRQQGALPLNLDLREVIAARLSGETQRAEEVLDHVVARATELGARWELGRARMLQAQFVSVNDPLRWKDALAHFREAEQLFSEMKELDNLAEVKRNKAGWLAYMGSRREALAAVDEAAGLMRRLDMRNQLAHLLLLSADFLRKTGELTTARKRLEEARLELEGVGAPPDTVLSSSAFRISGWLELDAGDLDRARQRIRDARRGATTPGLSASVELLEASVLNEGGDREQARAAYSKAIAASPLLPVVAVSMSGPIDRQVVPVAAACTVDCDGDQPLTGLTCLAERCQPGLPGIDGLQKSACLVEESRCSIRAHELGRAEKAARESMALLAGRDDYEPMLRTRIVLMQLAAARGNPGEARRVLREELAKAESLENRRLAFEVALALGGVELKSKPSAGRTRLLKLEQEAKSREFFRIARLAREALDEMPTVSTGPGR